MDNLLDKKDIQTKPYKEKEKGCIQKARKLGFKAKTPLKEGLASTVKWYLENRKTVAEH